MKLESFCSPLLDASFNKLYGSRPSWVDLRKGDELLRVSLRKIKKSLVLLLYGDLGFSCKQAGIK